MSTGGNQDRGSRPPTRLGEALGLSSREEESAALREFGVLPIRGDEQLWRGHILCKVSALMARDGHAVRLALQEHIDRSADGPR